MKVFSARQARPYSRADIFAEQTKIARITCARETAAYVWTSQSDPNYLPSTRLELAEREYKQALICELEAFGCPRVKVQLKEFTSDAIERAGLLVRGTARVSSGVALGIMWGALCGYLLPEFRSEQFGDLALTKCYQGGLTDIERATSSRTSALSAKRFYQLHAEIQRAIIMNRPANTGHTETEA
jgi:hypothetical protein